jgi:hypothetical protein
MAHERLVHGHYTYWIRIRTPSSDGKGSLHSILRELNRISMSDYKCSIDASGAYLGSVDFQHATHEHVIVQVCIFPCFQSMKSLIPRS